MSTPDVIGNDPLSHANGRKYLVITSDDFGMCHAVNAGIVPGLREGVLTSTTLMAPCPWFPEAAALTRKYQLNVGVHLCLTCEWDRMQWGLITHAPSLVGDDGYFLTNYPDLVKSAKDDEVLAEFDAQIERVKACGITPTHIDAHMLGGDDNRPGVGRFLDMLRQTCRKHGLIYTRDYDRKTGLIHFTDQIGSSGLPEPDIWKALEGWDKPGVYHIISHVAAAMPELEALCSDDHHARNWAAPYRVADMVFMTKPSTRARLGELGFELIDVPTFLALKNPK